MLKVALTVVLKVLLWAEKMAEMRVASTVEKKVVRSAGERAVSEMKIGDNNH